MVSTSSKRYIPERTVDSMLAAELVRNDPYALIWSPSQNDKFAVDHLVRTDGTTVVFECKAVLTDAPDREDGGGGGWSASIGVVQLEKYSKAPFEVLYVLAEGPATLSQPYNTHNCGLGPCDDSHRRCRCCPRDTRSWSAMNSRFWKTDLRLRWQPWFPHWTWVMSATVLWKWVKDVEGVSDAVRDKDKDFSVLVPVDRDQFRGRRTEGAVTRLCHLLAELRTPGTGLSAPGPLLAQFVVNNPAQLFEWSSVALDDSANNEIDSEESGTTPPLFANISPGQ